MRRSSKTVRGWFAMGCVLLCAGCNEGALLHSLETDQVSVGTRDDARIDLKHCANTVCDTVQPPRLAYQSADVPELACDTPVSSIDPTWKVGWTLTGIEACEDPCEVSGSPALAVGADDSLWILQEVSSGGSFAEQTDGSPVTLLLLLMHRARSGELLGSTVLDREALSTVSDDGGGTPGFSYNPQLVSLESGDLVAYVHKRWGEPFSPGFREEQWVVTVTGDGKQIGGRIPLEATVDRAPWTRPLRVEAAGGDRVAFAEFRYGADSRPGAFGVFDAEQRKLLWWQTRENLPHALDDIAVVKDGFSTLSMRTEIASEAFDSVEHYDSQGHLQWVRDIGHDPTTAFPALSRGGDGHTLYTTLLAHDPGLSDPDREEVVLHELDSDGERVRSVRWPLPYRGVRSSPGEGLAEQPRAVTLDEGAVVVPIGARTTSELRETLGLFGGVFYAVDSDWQHCHLTVVPDEFITTLLPAGRDGVYFNSDGAYGLVEVGIEE